MQKDLKNCKKKNWNSHFWPFQVYTSLFWKNCQKKIWNGHFWPFQIYASLLRKNCQKKIEKIFSDNFSVPITLIECDGLESNEICTFLDFYSESGTVIFGHFEFIPVILGKIARKNLEWSFLAIPILYQSF